MFKVLRAASVAAMVLMGGPALAQQAPPPPAPQTEALVGLAVYSSDGEKLGEVVKVGTAGGEHAVQAQIGGFLDVAPTPVVILASAFQQKPDRIELSMTAAEVKDKIANAPTK